VCFDLTHLALMKTVYAISRALIKSGDSFWRVAVTSLNDTCIECGEKEKQALIISSKLH
jgi:hypothetical protein